MYWLAAMGIGFVGGFHCLGMCGPIALALPFRTANKGTRLFGLGLYNLGRIFTYALLGFAFGYFGSHLRVAGLQRWLALTVGALLFLWAIATLLKWQAVKQAGNGIWTALSPLMAKLMRKHRLVLLPLLGLLNGLLPCGLVYMALGGSLMMVDPWEGAFFMAAFGAGTLPFMFAVSLLANKITPELRNRIRKIYPYIVLFMALLFLLRGMNLGIPYVSPKIDVAGGMATGCD